MVSCRQTLEVSRVCQNCTQLFTSFRHSCSSPARLMFPSSGRSLNQNYLQCPQTPPNQPLNVANFGSWCVQSVFPRCSRSSHLHSTCSDVSGNSFCNADTDPTTPFTTCAQLFPAAKCRITYCRGMHTYYCSSVFFFGCFLRG